MPRKPKPDGPKPCPVVEQRCFVEVTLDVIGGKWKPMILWHLIQGMKRFGELKRLMPQVTQQMLTTHLREMESHGVVHRRVYAEVPPKVEYSATELGKSLEPIMWQMHDWGERFVAAQEEAKIPLRKFSTTTKKIASRGFSKTKVKIASWGFAKGTAKIPSRKLSTAPKAAKKPETPLLLERPADETTRQERVAALKAKAKLKPASDL